MKIKKVLMALAMSACLTLGATGIAACAHEDNDGSVDTRDPQIAAVYQLYVASAEQNGDTPMTYEEWYADLLANAKGEKGDKGDKGDRGERGEIGVGIPGPQGEKGEKGEQGEKGADGKDGENGKSGAAGKDGNTWIVGGSDPGSWQGKNGDLYLNYTTWDVWHKVDGEWKHLGNIKGADGVGSAPEETEKVIMNLGPHTLAAGEEYSLNDLIDVDDGYYYLVAETEGAPERGALTMIITTGTKKPYDMYMPISNAYRGFVIANEHSVGAGKSSNKFSVKNNTSSEMKITSLKLVEFVAPVIEEGNETEILCLAPGYLQLPIDIDPALAGKEVKITISGWVNTTSTSKYVTVVGDDKSTAIFTFTASHYNDGVFEMTGTIPEGTTGLIFRDMTNTQSSNVAVKIEAVS